MGKRACYTHTAGMLLSSKKCHLNKKTLCDSSMEKPKPKTTYLELAFVGKGQQSTPANTGSLLLLLPGAGGQKAWPLGHWTASARATCNGDYTTPCSLHHLTVMWGEFYDLQIK